MCKEREDLALHLLIVMSRATRVIQAKALESIESHGINSTEFAVMELLYHKGPQPIQKIGKKILMTSGSMTYIVDRLEKKDMLERVRCEKDRRVIHAKLTNEGEALIQKIFPIHREHITEMMSVLTDEEKEIAIEILRKLGTSIHDFSAD